MNEVGWQYPEKDMPLTYETGVWDGKRSDKVVVEDDIERTMIARLYEGTMDGHKFQCWVDESDNIIDREIVRWLALPQ